MSSLETDESNGKVALVTGAASGIGRATALAFAERGVAVMAADIDEAGGEATVNRISELGGRGAFFALDVANEAQVSAMVERCVERFGGIDYALNNAGVEGDGSVGLADLAEEEWDRIMAVNLKGIWLCMKHEIPHMSKRGGGAIVNSSSVAGLRGSRASNVAYSASKYGILGMTKTAALQQASQNIRINAICPGLIDTAMSRRALEKTENVSQVASAIPLGRWGEADEIARTVIWLCSGQASYITGVALPIDGGMST
ncbi:MAG: glucose 1-dehydrogenase [Gammaproteobacteria bacterium]|nr:glucose 1-dehydrogenase [Gammaproteobacteria bacterium]